MNYIWHNLSVEKIFQILKTNKNGLVEKEVEERLTKYGKNELPRKESFSLFKIVLDQFKSPLIYILLIAAGISLILKELNWRPSISFLDGLKETVSWYINNENWWRKIKNKN